MEKPSVIISNSATTLAQNGVSVLLTQINEPKVGLYYVNDHVMGLMASQSMAKE